MGKSRCLSRQRSVRALAAAAGGLFNFGSQFISNGFDLRGIDPRQVVSAAAGGFVAGGAAGLTLGAIAAPGIGAAAVVNGTANVAGGFVSRETNDLLGVLRDANAPSGWGAVAPDFASGFIGGGLGARSANVRYPLPNVRRQLNRIAHSNHRSKRPAKIAAFRQYANQQQIHHTVVSSVVGAAYTNSASELFFRLGSLSGPPAAEPKPEVTVRLCFPTVGGTQVCG